MLTLDEEKRKERHRSFGHFFTHGCRSQNSWFKWNEHLIFNSLNKPLFLLAKNKPLCFYTEREFIKTFHVPHRNILENQRVKLGGCTAQIISQSQGRTAEEPPQPDTEEQICPPCWESAASPGTGQGKHGALGSLSTYHWHSFQLVNAPAHWFLKYF